MTKKVPKKEKHWSHYLKLDEPWYMKDMVYREHPVMVKLKKARRSKMTKKRYTLNKCVQCEKRRKNLYSTYIGIWKTCRECINKEDWNNLLPEKVIPFLARLPKVKK